MSSIDANTDGGWFYERTDAGWDINNENGVVVTSVVDPTHEREDTARLLVGCVGEAEKLDRARKSAPIFWSQNAEAACTEHAPKPESDAWRLGGWREMTLAERIQHAATVGNELECDRCARRATP